MDEIGTPQLSWVRGYNGGHAKYIDRNTVAYACGNNVNFVKEGGESQVFTSPGEGVTCLEVHQLNKHFAFAENCLKPRIFVFNYPDMGPVSELKDVAELEYIALAFSTSDYLISIAGVPQYQMTLWNYQKGESLLTVDLIHRPVTSLSVNPGNWRQICVTTEETFTVFTVEQSDIRYSSGAKNVKMFVGESSGELSRIDESPSRAVDVQTMQRLDVDLSPSAIAGLLESEAEQFEDLRDSRLKCVPVSHSWTPKGDILIGCKGGQLLRLDGESWHLFAIFTPQVMDRRKSRVPITRGTLLSREMSIMEEDDSTIYPEESSNMIGPGSIDCMALHKNGLYIGGEDGTLRCVDTTGDRIRLIDSYPTGSPITCLNFCTTWNHLNVGSSAGTLNTYDIANPGNITKFIDDHAGNFVSIGHVAPDMDHSVTIRANGFLQVWSLSNGLCEGNMAFGIEAVTMVTSHVAPLAVIGTKSGFLFMVDLSEISNPRIVHRVRAYNCPVTHIAYTNDGRYILTGSDDGNIIVMSGRAQTMFKMIGFTGVEGIVETITTLTDQKSGTVKVVVSSNTTGNAGHGANKCNTFELTDTVMASAEQYYNSLKADFQDEAINKIVFNYASPSYGACLVGPNLLYSLAQDNKMLQKLTVPKEKPKKPNSKDSFLLPDEELVSHQLPGGRLAISPHEKWMASGGMDGKLQIRVLSATERYVEVHPHDYRHGGVKDVHWSLGSQHILTCGRDDGILCCYTWRYTPSGEVKGNSAVAAAKQAQSRLAEAILQERDALKSLAEWTPDPSKLTLESSHHTSPSPIEVDEASTLSNIERAINNDDIYMTPTPVPKADGTWIEARQLLAHTEEDKEYTDVKKDLRYEIREIRRTLQGIMEKNKSVPDIEKLQHHDFDLDIDEQHRLQAVGDAEVQRIKEEIEFENLAKQYLTHLIKQECWDSMEIKGRSIEGFSVPLEVQNYPMQKRSREELDELSRSIAIRRIEIAEAKTRAELVEIMVPKPSQTQFDEFDDMDESVQPAVTGGDDAGDDEDVQTDFPSITGSAGSMYGGKSDLYYNQFELFSREQKIHQVILLKDAIYRIKQTFNKEFDEVLTKKESELTKINEKNKRIAKIFKDLDILETVKPHPVSTKEKPELLLTVQDAEVTVERYLTPEQQKAKEEFEKAEEERRRKEQGDNARERALDQMMGGVLEIKKEDELKKDVPIPPFMQTKGQDDWSEEEHKIAKEYERKVKELNEERDKYRKQLEAELKKLQLLISEAEQSFNDALRLLFTKKLKVEMVICQEELKIVRLQYGLMVQSALETSEKQLLARITHKKAVKLLAAEAYIQARKNVDNFKEGYDILVAEDKVMDKGFKREFSDCTALHVEQLYKLFRKRPRGQKSLHNRGETPILDASSGNPFAERPSTSRQFQMQKQAVVTALADMDKPSNMPEGLDHSVWERLCIYRSHKIESEQLVKQKALIMAEMMAFQQKRQDEDYKIAEEIDDLGQELLKLKELMQRNALNLQVQLLMKQGQVELDAGPFIHDYTASVLVHRGVVEDLNGRIKALGESKIASMVESKDFRKGIIQLEWQHKKNLMKIEDLKNRMRDINMMKVTRQIQSYLNEEDHEAKIAQEVSILEQTILMQKKHHEANVENLRKIVGELKYSQKDKELENSVLLKEIEGLNVSVNERNHIQEASADKNEESNREKRYLEIVQRRKLVDLAKAQANEVAVLRAEVERLRMRTFPALVQVER